jgi:hypothetical protein
MEGKRMLMALDFSGQNGAGFGNLSLLYCKEQIVAAFIELYKKAYMEATRSGAVPAEDASHIELIIKQTVNDAIRDTGDIPAFPNKTGLQRAIEVLAKKALMWGGVRRNEIDAIIRRLQTELDQA